MAVFLQVMQLMRSEDASLFLVPHFLSSAFEVFCVIDILSSSQHLINDNSLEDKRFDYEILGRVGSEESYDLLNFRCCPNAGFFLQKIFCVLGNSP